MNFEMNDSTPIAMLTVRQLKEIIGCREEPVTVLDTTGDQKRYMYGLGGIARLFNCSMPTVSRIKKSGKINEAIPAGRVKNHF